MTTQTIKPTRTRWGVHLSLIVICLVMCIPILYALQVATLTLEQNAFPPPRLFPPGSDLLPNLNDLFTTLNFGQYILNTVIVGGVIVIGKTTLALLAGLAFVYFRFVGKNLLFFVVLFTLLMPTEIILLPLFNMVSQFGWGQNYPQLALTLPFIATATGTFLFRQHFSNIPRELVEASQIDGATPVRFLFSVLIPMSWNVIVAHSLIQFLTAWNQYLWAVLIVNPNDLTSQVIQVGVTKASTFGVNVDYGLLMTAGLVASVPPILLFIGLQRQFMSGFALTKDK